MDDFGAGVQAEIESSSADIVVSTARCPPACWCQRSGAPAPSGYSGTWRGCELGTPWALAERKPERVPRLRSLAPASAQELWAESPAMARAVFEVAVGSELVSILIVEFELIFENRLESMFLLRSIVF